jgi:hypothetical protein
MSRPKLILAYFVKSEVVPRITVEGSYCRACISIFEHHFNSLRALSYIKNMVENRDADEGGNEISVDEPAMCKLVRIRPFFLSTITPVPVNAPALDRTERVSGEGEDVAMLMGDLDMRTSPNQVYTGRIAQH